MLGQLWKDCVGSLAYVRHICFDKKTYLSIELSNSQTNAISEEVDIYFNGGDSRQSVVERWKYKHKSTKVVRQTMEEDIPF